MTPELEPRYLLISRPLTFKMPEPRVPLARSPSSSAPIRELSAVAAFVDAWQRGVVAPNG